MIATSNTQATATYLRLRPTPIASARAEMPTYRRIAKSGRSAATAATTAMIAVPTLPTACEADQLKSRPYRHVRVAFTMFHAPKSMTPIPLTISELWYLRNSLSIYIPKTRLRDTWSDPRPSQAPRS